MSKTDDHLSSFDPRSAIFVCNKWDQVLISWLVELDRVKVSMSGPPDLQGQDQDQGHQKDSFHGLFLCLI